MHNYRSFNGWKKRRISVKNSDSVLLIFTKDSRRKTVENFFSFRSMSSGSQYEFETQRIISNLIEFPS